MTSPIHRRATRLVAGASVAVMLAACSDGSEPLTLPSPTEEATASPSPTEEPSPSPSPSPADPFAVPDEITADYVERVLNEINRLDAEMTRQVLGSPVNEQATELPDDVESTLTSVYAPPIQQFNRNALLDLLRSEESRANVLPPDEYGQQRTTVEAVLLTESPCTLARISKDYTETDADIDPSTSTVSFVVLLREDGANSTGWKLARSLGADVEADSPQEEELRSFTANDLADQLPEACE